MFRNKQKGFTLVELLITVVVFAMIATVVVCVWVCVHFLSKVW